MLVWFKQRTFWLNCNALATRPLSVGQLRYMSVINQNHFSGFLSFFLKTKRRNGTDIWKVMLMEFVLLFLLKFLPYSRWAFSGLLTDEGWGWGRGLKRPPLPKICLTYPRMMKLGTVIPYLNKIQRIYESRDTPPDFYWHQHFFTRNLQILLYQEIQI